MFHARLLELESEILAKEQAARGLEQLPPECAILVEQLQNEIGLKLGDKAAKDYKGWLSYKRSKESLVICRGRAFNLGGIFAKWYAGFDVVNGADSAREAQRAFDVTPAQELDHLQVNFGAGESVRVFLWYGENIAPYRLIFAAEMSDEPEKQLQNAIVEACTWILTKPKGQTLPEFLAQKKQVQG
ncbi:MAG TPA: hypothetical protein V6C81_05505 [Planktothrix sp.]|jgi:hypothetical protein